MRHAQFEFKVCNMIRLISKPYLIHELVGEDGKLVAVSVTREKNDSLCIWIFDYERYVLSIGGPPISKIRAEEKLLQEIFDEFSACTIADVKHALTFVSSEIHIPDSFPGLRKLDMMEDDEKTKLLRQVEGWLEGIYWSEVAQKRPRRRSR